MTFTTGLLEIDRVVARVEYVFVKFSDHSMLQLPLDDAKKLADLIYQALLDREVSQNDGVAISPSTGRPVTT